MALNSQTNFDTKTKVWSGPEVPKKSAADISLGKTLLEALLQEPTKIAQICYPSGKAYTNQEIATLSISVAHHLAKLNLSQCDVIGICASNTDFVAPLVFGAIFNGLAISPLDVSFDKEGIKHAYSITKPKLMFCDGGIYDRVKEALQEIGLNIDIYTMKEHIAGQPSINDFLSYTTVSVLEYNFEPLKMGPTQTAVIVASSGTTGLPKGIIITYENLLQTSSGLPPYSRGLSFVPLHWISGTIALFGCTLDAHTRIISDKPFSADDCFDIVEKYHPNIIMTSAIYLTTILVSPKLKITDLSNIQLWVTTGSAAPYPVVKQLKQYMPKTIFMQAYGMSETLAAIAAGLVQETVGFIGPLAPNIQLIVVDDDGRKLGPSEIGEFRIKKTSSKWQGYYDNKDATAAAYDDEGWYMTGDLGFIDEQANLHLIDRKKDILKYRGFQYFPTEIEQVIRELDDVEEVCVCGLPDLSLGNLPTAAVVKKIGTDLKEQDVYEHVAKRLVHFKHLRGGVYFLNELPLTSTGKVLRREVKKICEKLRNEKLQEKST